MKKFILVLSLLSTLSAYSIEQVSDFTKPSYGCVLDIDSHPECGGIVMVHSLVLTVTSLVLLTTIFPKMDSENINFMIENYEVTGEISPDFRSVIQQVKSEIEKLEIEKTELEIIQEIEEVALALSK
jgi:hypothetical protein